LLLLLVVVVVVCSGGGGYSCSFLLLHRRLHFTQLGEESRQIVVSHGWMSDACVARKGLKAVCDIGAYTWDFSAVCR
jgi:hypothetical protein